MTTQTTVLQSSPLTRTWLQALRDNLPDLEYSEARYWASFRSTSRARLVAQLNPGKRGIRLFLPLDPTDDSRLSSSPSTSAWAKRWPSVYAIASTDDIPGAVQLIRMASALNDRLVPRLPSRRPAHVAAEELTPVGEYFEGATRTVHVNAFERNQRARRKCIEHYGVTCSICAFDFEAVYGDWASGYIHVHHVVPISSVRETYRLDPIADLRPVCANCHAVLHRRDPPFSIDEVKQMLRDRSEATPN